MLYIHRLVFPDIGFRSFSPRQKFPLYARNRIARVTWMQMRELLWRPRLNRCKECIVWELNCCYGLIIAEWQVSLISIVLKLITLYRIWSRPGLSIWWNTRFFSFYLKGRMTTWVRSMLEKSPGWQTITCWSWWRKREGFNQCAVTKDVERNLRAPTPRCGCYLDQRNPKWRQHASFSESGLKSNITSRPLRKCILRGGWRVICYNCGIIGHQKASGQWRCTVMLRCLGDGYWTGVSKGNNGRLGPRV